MGCEVTFHHRISQDRLTAAVAPQTSAAFHKLLESALAETSEAALGAQDVEIELTLGDLAEIDSATPAGAAAGARYTEAGLRTVGR